MSALEQQVGTRHLVYQLRVSFQIWWRHNWQSMRSWCRVEDQLVFPAAVAPLTAGGSPLAAWLCNGLTSVSPVFHSLKWASASMVVSSAADRCRRSAMTEHPRRMTPSPTCDSSALRTDRGRWRHSFGSRLLLCRRLRWSLLSTTMTTCQEGTSWGAAPSSSWSARGRYRGPMRVDRHICEDPKTTFATKFSFSQTFWICVTDCIQDQTSQSCRDYSTKILLLYFVKWTLYEILIGFRQYILVEAYTKAL